MCQWEINVRTMLSNCDEDIASACSIKRLKSYHYFCVCCDNSWRQYDNSADEECRKCGSIIEPRIVREVKYVLVEQRRVCICLLCGEEITSAHLDGAIADDKAYYMACMVMHYRHEHVRYYNNSVGYVSRHHDYESFKSKVNERAKRNIIRKCMEILRANGVTSETFLLLENNDSETIKLAKKLLDSPTPLTRRKQSRRAKAA